MRLEKIYDLSNKRGELIKKYSAQKKKVEATEEKSGEYNKEQEKLSQIKERYRALDNIVENLISLEGDIAAKIEEVFELNNSDKQREKKLRKEVAELKIEVKKLEEKRL